MKYPWAALGVLVLHGSFLVSCAPIKEILAPQKQAGHVQIQEKRVSDFQFIPMGESPLSCPKRYIGIGIRFDWGVQNIVVKVAPGSPAEKAGIEVGDILLTDEYFGALPVGTVVTLPIEKNGVQSVVQMKVNYICYDE